MRNKTDLKQVSAYVATVVFNNAGDDFNVWQLSPLLGTLLRLCDGRRTVAEITQEFSLLETGLEGIPPTKA